MEKTKKSPRMLMFIWCVFPHILVWGSSFLCLIRLLPPASRRLRLRLLLPHRDNPHETTHTEITHTETTHTEIILPPHRDNTYRDHTPRQHTQRQHTPRRHIQRSHTHRDHTHRDNTHRDHVQISWQAQHFGTTHAETSPEFVAGTALCEPP